MNPASLAAWTAALFFSSALFSHTVALRLMLLILGIVFAVAATVRDRPTIHPVPSIWLPFLLWAVWAGLSLAWSQEPERSVKEFRNEIVYAGLALWVCYVGAQARNAARIILPVAGAALVLLCALALYHFPQGLERYAAGWHGGPGNLSSALVTLFPCAVMAVWYGRRAGWAPAALIGVVIPALLLVAAYTTLNRTIWLGFAAQLLLIAGLLTLRARHSIGPRAKKIGAALVIALIAGTALITFRIQAEREASGAAIAMANDPRFSLWPEIIEHVEQRPLTGYGFGRGMLRQSLNEDFKDPLLWHAHNLFLDTLLQLGIPGLVLLLFLLGATLREGLRMARAPNDLTVACGIALIGVVAGMVVRNMTDTLWVRQNALQYWAVVGVLLAWGRAGRVPVDR